MTRKLIGELKKDGETLVKTQILVEGFHELVFDFAKTQTKLSEDVYRVDNIRDFILTLDLITSKLLQNEHNFKFLMGEFEKDIKSSLVGNELLAYTLDKLVDTFILFQSYTVYNSLNIANIKITPEGLMPEGSEYLIYWEEVND